MSVSRQEKHPEESVALCRRRSDFWKGNPGLLGLQGFVNGDGPVLLDRDDFLHRLVAGESNVDDVIAGIQQEFHGRVLVQHPAVDRDLRSFGSGLDGDLTHASLGVLAAKKFPDFPDGLDVLGITQLPESGCEMVRLAGLSGGRGRLIEITGLADQNGMRPLIQRDLRRGYSLCVFAVKIDCSACGFTRVAR